MKKFILGTSVLLSSFLFHPVSSVGDEPSPASLSQKPPIATDYQQVSYQMFHPMPTNEEFAACMKVFYDTMEKLRGPKTFGGLMDRLARSAEEARAKSNVSFEFVKASEKDKQSIVLLLRGASGSTFFAPIASVKGNPLPTTPVQETILSFTVVPVSYSL